MQLLKERYKKLLASQATAKQTMWGASPTPVNTNLTSEVVDLILAEAIRMRTSDIHFEPFPDHLRIRFRIDGNLYEVLEIEDKSNLTILPRIKILSNLSVDVASSRKAMDSRFSATINNQQYDFRVATFPTILGEKIVLRILQKDLGLVDLKRIGLSPKDCARLEKIIQYKSGLLIVSGPTGSGKTTTLYSIVNRLHSPGLNIVTLEDPVEYQINGMNQCAINEKIGETFAAGLKAILRQDPNVILIGEIRDMETAEIAIRASITGHLVLTSLHSNNALGTVIRLINMGLERYLVSYALIGAVAQRLVPRLCDRCRAPYKANMAAIKKVCEQSGISTESLLSLNQPQTHGDGDVQYVIKNESATEELTFYKKTGCSFCNGTGYSGRIGIFEVIYFSEQLRDAILRNATTRELISIAQQTEISSLALDALEKFKNGLVTLDDIYPILLENSSDPIPAKPHSTQHL